MTTEPRSRAEQYGKGTVWFDARHNRWCAQASAQGPDGKRTRPTFTGDTREDVEAQLAHWRATGEKVVRPRRNRPRAYAGAPVRNPRRLSRRTVIERVIHASRRFGWTDAELVRILTAQLSQGRIAHGVYGPCVYCGTWEAGHVDHVVPKSRGGTDDPTNLVSACQPCNYAKHDRMLDEWRVA